jgi:superfamily II DNA or RNA helicase
MKLREHQELALQLARQSIREGKKRPIIAAPTSFGKTILAGQMLKNCQDQGKKGWFFVDRKQLVEQSIDKFSQMGIEFGVHQAGHPLTNPTKPIQIASIQTIAAMCGKHNRNLPIFDFALVDECHTSYSIMDKLLTTYNNLPIIGLTATPYAKGLGKKYNNLIVPITPRELLDKGFLSPVRYYGGEHIDLSKIRSVNPNTYSAQDIEAATEQDNDRLAGCIIRNWLEFGENSQTIAFSPTKHLSRSLVERFNRNGISAEHIDCDFSQEDREAIFEAHDRGEFKVLSCSRLLNTGYDAPSVKCIVDCFPTKSITTYVQRVGRIMRTHDTKDYAIYLDHASNFERFGYAEDIVPESLHDGEQTHNERELTKKDKKELKTRECPQCHQQMAGYMCKACGYEVPRAEQLEDDGKMLQEIENMEGKKANRTTPQEIKEQFLSELHCYARQKNYKEGWAANKYRERFGVWPNRINAHHTDTVGDMTANWLKHSNIKWANRRGA